MTVRFVSLCFAFFVCDVTANLPNDCGVISRCETNSVSMSRNSCRCDNECTLYGDCCSGFTPSANARSGASLLYELLECLRVDFTGDLLDDGVKSLPMVSGCRQPTEHKDQCTNASLFLPVTDPHTNFTFRNIYCALCNNISQDQVVPWIAEFSCSSNIVQSLQANSSRMNWTFEAFREACFLNKYVAPTTKAPDRNCIPHVSTCSNNSSSSPDLVHNCTRGPYDLVTTLDKRIFRNQYCALCNGVNNTQCLRLSVLVTSGGHIAGDCIYTMQSL